MDSAPHPHAAWLRRPLAQGLLLCAVTAAAYAGCARAGFVFDDFALVVYSRDTLGLAHPLHFFTQDLWALADGGGGSGYYRPLMGLSLAVDRAIFGLAPIGYHLHSLAWHLLAVLALHRLLLRLARPLPALLGAALFALHPLQSEAVLWISARNDAMAAALLLCAIGLLASPAPGWRRLGLGALAALGAVLSKESALLMPIFLLLLDLGRFGRPRGWERHAVLWGAAGVHLGLRALAHVNAAAAPSALGWRVLRARAPAVLATVGDLLAWPWPLSIGRDLESLRLAPGLLVAGLAVCALLPLLLILPREGRRLAATGLGWAALGAAPAVLALADKALFGERYLYLSLAGLALAVAAATGSLAARAPARTSLLLALALPWCLLIHARTPDWRDDVSLWQAALRDTPSGFVAASLGHVLARAGRKEEALALFEAALDSIPSHTEVCPKIARLAQETGDVARAAGIVEVAAAHGCDDDDFSGQRAALLAATGRWEEAERLAAAHEADRQGRAQVVLASAALVRGDCARYRALLAAFARPEELDVQMERILALGGLPELSAALRAGAACPPPGGRE
jgi:tetratricopeptide (TPR) repeat protein